MPRPPLRLVNTGPPARVPGAPARDGAVGGGGGRGTQRGGGGAGAAAVRPPPRPGTGADGTRPTARAAWRRTTAPPNVPRRLRPAAGRPAGPPPPGRGARRYSRPPARPPPLSWTAA